jgi:hypothetical protein
VTYEMVRTEQLEWITRPHEPGEPARHVAELSDRARFAHTRANLWRYDPGAAGRRHRHHVAPGELIDRERGGAERDRQPRRCPSGIVART